MQFGLTDDESRFRDHVRALAAKEFADGYLGRAVTEEFPWDGYRRLGEFHLLGLMFSEEFGGQAASFVATGAALEALAYADFNLAFLAYFAALPSVERLVPESLRAEVLPRIVRGEEILAYGVTEPGGGSDLAATRARAERVDGGWRLNGEKTSVSLVGVAERAVVFARASDAPGAAGIGGFLVDLQAPGVSRSGFHDVGCLPLGRGSLFLDDVFVPDERVSAAPGAGFFDIVDTFNYTRPLLGLMSVGAAQASLDEAAAYADEREAFGRKISAYQGVTFPLVEATARVAGARHLCYEALWLRDQGLSQRAQGALSKWYSCEEALRAIEAAMVTMGHYAYSTDSPHQQRLRDVMGLLFGEGTPQIMKRIAARAVWKDAS
ncbi:MAG: acyl-CoA dehydrogenase family protein [Actinomycetota bacterium]